MPTSPSPAASPLGRAPAFLFGGRARRRRIHLVLGGALAMPYVLVGAVVGEAATGAEAVSVARELRPDVVLTDVRMPGTDGIRATERILAGSGGAPGS